MKNEDVKNISLVRAVLNKQPTDMKIIGQKLSLSNSGIYGYVIEFDPETNICWLEMIDEQSKSNLESAGFYKFKYTN